MTWKEENNSLQTDIVFKDFIQAFAFMTEIAIHAEKINHHPTWTNTYNRVNIVLTTHDTGNTVTEKDRKLADIISQIVLRYQ
jgi:4a-hydroxytetrahydrobiopterin dehydratase